MTVPEDHNSTPTGTAIPVGSWLALTVIVIGTAMVVLDSTIVNVALPEIGRSLKASTGVEWVVTIYLLAVSASLPATGWLADRFGRRSVFMWSMAVFTGASLGCALSPNFAALIAFRALQGVGGGAIPAVGMAILLEIFPRHQHGRAISTWGMAALLSPAFGPTFGGWLVTAFSWHWLFLINVPIGAFALIVSPRLLPDLAPREHHQLDLASVPLGAAALSLTVLALSNGSQWGWTSPRTSGAGLTGLLLLGWFIRRNLRRTHPLLDLGLLRNRAFSAAVTVTFTLQVVNFARLVFVPLELETVHHYSAFRVGLLLAPSAVVTAVCMKIGGRMVDRLGPRLPAIAGATVMMLGTAALAAVRTTTPGWAVALALCLQAGFGLSSAGVAVAAMSDLPGELLAQASVLRNLTNQVAGAVSVAGFGALLSAAGGLSARGSRAQYGFNVVFVAATALAAIAIFLATRIIGDWRPAEYEVSPMRLIAPGE